VASAIHTVLLKITARPCPLQTIEFIEEDGELPPYTGDHFCFYITDFKKAFDRCKELGLVWINPRFTHLDKTESYEDALIYKQFRIRDIVGKSGELLIRQELEIRMVDHHAYPLHQQK